MVMIQTKEIKHYVKNKSTLRQNIIRLYNLIWGQRLSTLQSELEVNPYYYTHSLTYYCLCMFTNINICTSSIYHKFNGYYSVFMAMRAIFCLQQGWDEPTKAYYRRFEAAISTSEIAKFTAMTHVELNKTYPGGMMTTSPRGFRLYSYSCQPIVLYTQGLGSTWITLPSWLQKTTQRLQPPPMMYCHVTRSWRHNDNPIHHPGR